jgi:alpha-tubulin suppressor-like RCC1 family protein
MANTFFQVNGSDVTNYFVPRDVFSSGQLWGCGYNVTGQLGLGYTGPNKSSFVQSVDGGLNWKQISAGFMNFAGGIKTDGTLWTWGENAYGQLGNNDGTATAKSSPVQTSLSGTNWKQISCGENSVLAIKTDGNLWSWGDNTYGQLGTNNRIGYLSPTQAVLNANNWKQVSCSNVSAGIKTDGTLWTWGNNSAGQLGTNNTTSYSSPVQTVAGGTNWKQVSCRSSHVAAIKTDGTLWTWGDNSFYGVLGVNDRVNRSSPVQTISAGNNWKQVSCGNYCTAAIKTDGTLWMWGANDYGQLGTNNTTSYSSPVQTVAGGTNWKIIITGTNQTSAIKTNGTLWSWGDNTYGQLGNNSATTYYSSPVQSIDGGTNWKQVVCGSGTTLAITDVS